MNAVVATDDTSLSASYLNSTLTSALNKAKTAASAFGDYQIAVRESVYNDVGTANPRASLYARDLAWATNAKSLWNQYFNATASSVEDYVFALTAAYSNYASATLSALATSENAYYNAFKTYSINAADAEVNYALAIFNAEKTRELAYLDAAVAELTANYAKEAELAGARASAYEGKNQAAKACVGGTQFQQKLYMYDVQSASASERTAYFDEVETAANQVVAIQNSANGDDANHATQNAAALEAAQAANAAARTTAEEAAEQEFKQTTERAWRDAYAANLELGATFKAAFEGVETNYNNALNAASAAYRDAAFAAWDDFDDNIKELAKTLEYQEARLNLGLNIPSDAFENATDDFEICFAAGTQILMADGSTKPIERIEPGDLVLASRHDRPEGTPTEARVVRTFDNGLKDVVRLKFENGEELICTPDHPFYVVDRGWTSANELHFGDSCLSSNGERVVFANRETLGEKRRVFNFEVERRHTYFVGARKAILAHNLCYGHHFLPFSVMRDVFLENSELFSEDAIEVASGFYSEKLDGGHGYSKEHSEYNKKVKALFQEYVDEFKEKNPGKVIGKDNMMKFITENVIPGKNLKGEIIEEIRVFNNKEIKKVADNNLKKALEESMSIKLSDDPPTYNSLMKKVKENGAKLLKHDKRYKILGNLFNNKNMLRSLSFFAAINIVRDCRAASNDAPEIIDDAYNEALKIANDNTMALNEKRTAFHLYVWTITRKYYESNWAADFVMYYRLLNLFRNNP